MNDIMELKGVEPRKILKALTEQKLPAIMSYMSKGKWHVAKVLLTDIGATWLTAEVAARKSPQPINIRIDQPVGISVKYGYGKFIFETRVVALEPSGKPDCGGIISIVLPDRMEMVQRRSYFRVEVPAAMKVNALVWHRRGNEGNSVGDPENYFQATLVDISAGGLQVAIDSTHKTDFRKGQFVCIRFTPMPYETPLMFDAQIRTILPTADSERLCLGMQIVGLETSSKGRETLSRLVEVVEHYYQMNRCDVRQRNLQPAEPPDRI